MSEPSTTYHQKILDDVRNAIVSGAWPPGFRIPFENDMARDYGVSRMTVNKALSQLAREGFIERRRKVGSFVNAPRVQSAVVEIADIKAEVKLAGHQHSYHQLHHEIRIATAEDRRRLHITGESPRVLVLQGLHSADGSPYCLEDRLINVSAVPEAAGVSFATEPAGSWLLRQVPWSSAQHTIRAVEADATRARLLKLPPGKACLEIERLTQRASESITFARLTYPGDRHQLVARFTPSTS